MTSPLSSPPSVVPTSSSNIRVLTFNVRGSFHRQDGPNVWNNRKELNLKTIQACDPDIIGFQEVQSGNFQYYDESFLAQDYDHVKGHACKRTMNWNLQDLQDSWSSSSNHVYNYVTRNLGSSSDQDEYVPIYWKRNRFELIRHGSFYLSETPTVESIGWQSKLIRAATWVCLRDKQESTNNAECIVLNTHLPHERHDATRTECACVILQQLAAMSSTPHHIVLGDFNCHASSPETEAYATFLENGYQDTVVEDEIQDANKKASTRQRLDTYHNFMGETCPFSLGRIDWILIKNNNDSDKNNGKRIEIVQSARIIRDCQLPLYPSDHYPVVADLKLQ
ncbi:Endonuclease Exonuclease phosphatase [Seminavis robusta]|uniref:Endonuclease Exonuclease phosphatase n=1 Tax=Seminavis robusta TaxID=568900 RepID=A0A9N8F241_9STRA|nr:Endonuclease Exonuclease phosphatase [Seminavis robusta]|eukprot:Sro2652_g333700.1 Endonuclease Exonuclease phosphatase (336) ;mRNA; r:2868-3875